MDRRSRAPRRSKYALVVEPAAVQDRVQTRPECRTPRRPLFRPTWVPNLEIDQPQCLRRTNTLQGTCLELEALAARSSLPDATTARSFERDISTRTSGAVHICQSLDSTRGYDPNPNATKWPGKARRTPTRTQGSTPGRSIPALSSPILRFGKALTHALPSTLELHAQRLTDERKSTPPP